MYKQKQLKKLTASSPCPLQVESAVDNQKVGPIEGGCTGSVELAEKKLEEGKLVRGYPSRPLSCER